MTVLEQAAQARAASIELAAATRAEKDAALLLMAERLVERSDDIVAANAADVSNARTAGMTDAMIDRLTLTADRVAAMAAGLLQLAALPDPVGDVVRGSTLANGLELRQIRVPFGVVGIIYEARPNVTADAAGIRQLVDELDHHGVTHVAIERPDGPVVDALLATGRTVVVIAPRQIKHLRTRYGSTGHKDDRFDAFVLADVLRTDAHRLQPLPPDTPQTMALRSAVRARTDLVQARVALCNQLRAHLRAVFPAAVGLFAGIGDRRDE